MISSYQVVSCFVCFCVLKCICRFEIKQPIEYTSSCTKNFNFVSKGGGDSLIKVGMDVRECKT